MIINRMLWPVSFFFYSCAQCSWYLWEFFFSFPHRLFIRDIYYTMNFIWNRSRYICLIIKICLTNAQNCTHGLPTLHNEFIQIWRDIKIYFWLFNIINIYSARFFLALCGRHPIGFEFSYSCWVVSSGLSLN